ncbi:MAG TPA: hypothetical protein VLK23_09235 [Thermodesulfobacteriota bacterium]|nr:hypothetical protein [Thermodesulfobacteriota bacterium]
MDGGDSVFPIIITITTTITIILTMITVTIRESGALLPWLEVQDFAVAFLEAEDFQEGEEWFLQEKLRGDIDEVPSFSHASSEVSLGGFCQVILNDT